MRILFLDSFETLVVDILAWVIFHLSIGYTTSKIHVDKFNPDRKWYQTKPWEKGGEVYQQIFRVKDWKKFIPSGAALYKGAYEIKNMVSYSVQNVRLWLKESCRAEFCHWMMILPGFFFFLWNSTAGAWVNLAYAILNNLVPIVMQRYNRPRVRKLLLQLERKSNTKEEPAINYAPQTSYSHSYR
ncbi:MAG: hypothetical protein ABFD24_03255 [Anaerolineaceae bacterium]